MVMSHQWDSTAYGSGCGIGKFYFLRMDVDDGLLATFIFCAWMMECD